jgi:hypothetical protein
MCSEHNRRCGLGLTLALLCLGAGLAVAQESLPVPRFRPDDPLTVDDDRRHDARGFDEVELAESYDFFINEFTSPGERRDIPAVNVNTLGEVPDSSWFTNRIGVRAMDATELARGPHKFDTADGLTWDTWTVTQGKGPGGFHPGFRAERPGDPGQIYQLEIDPVGFPRLATGAEIIGTLIYHALGYHTQDVYPVRVHPSKLTVSPKATVRDASGRRRMTQADLDHLLTRAARDAEGRVFFSATRFEEGRDVGNFEYIGTRRDDPNDIYPHEHRRELRGNRVFAAWLAHDDSRALNTRNMLKTVDDKRVVEHFMYDFGAIMGSATRFPDNPISNHEYYVDRAGSIRALFTLGLVAPKPLRIPVSRDIPPSAGQFESETFDPLRWKANYPNTAFDNMQPDDAFWAARLVARFSDEALGAIVRAADYDDPSAIDYLVGVLGRRRDAIARAWLTPINPVADVALAADGTVTFVNAAVDAGAATAPAAYRLTWARFDNAAGTLAEAGTDRVSAPRAAAPAALLAEAPFIALTIAADHPDHPAWARPVRVFFRRSGSGWTTVGLQRDVRRSAGRRQ